mgnify:CR=1 FL=1|jgi:hypothetical protein|nr:MAG TPA: hypothetical protein [Bacteriophage sp.]
MNFIQYIKQAWKAGTSGGTPLSPDRLNHMEDGIKNNNSMISELNNNNITNNICTNLLNPTLKTSSRNGITCTNNGDGTYTLNGTASDSTVFVLENTADIIKENANKTLRFVSRGDALGTYFVQIYFNNATPAKDLGSGITFKVPTNVSETNVAVAIISGTVLSNIIIKPMLTTNLNATYDDFVPYTGNTGRLNADVALLNNNISNTDNKIKTYYISTPTELTFKKGTYWVFINKTQYSQSSIWTVDSSANPPVALANPSGEKMTKVLNDDNTMTIKWNNASYAAVSLLKVVVN